MNSSSHFDSARHFLFMLPSPTTAAEQEQIEKAAKQLACEGYVYVASAHERTMEDRDNIRFMPFRHDDLPRFGMLTSVIIAKDQAMAGAAEKAYPGAKVIVIDPADAAHVVKYEQRRPRGGVTMPMAEAA
jgi:hypothetical protein